MNRFYIFLMATLLNVQAFLLSSEKQNYVMWEKLTENSQKILSDILDKEQFDNLQIPIPTDNKGSLLCKKRRPEFLISLLPMNDQSAEQQYNISPICTHIVLDSNKIVNRY